MELAFSGNSLKTFNRSIASLARVGTELVLQASPSQLVFHTLNSSRSAYQSITFKPDFFDAFNLHPNNSDRIQCSVLLKSVSSILRTPVSNVDRLSATLPSADAAKIQWTLQCHSGVQGKSLHHISQPTVWDKPTKFAQYVTNDEMLKEINLTINRVKKTYWISCNVEPDIQHLSLDRRRFPSSFIVRPRDLTRLLSNFQSSLQEITIIATEPSAMPSDAAGEIGGKAVELRSYIDPAKDNSDLALHTQLWIDPAEEFLQYTHNGDPVDVTFGVKELKAFLLFCEGCEVDIHLFFEKAGEPILMAPRFGFDDGSNSDFDATLVLATMLSSQLSEVNIADHPPAASVPHAQDVRGNGSCPSVPHAQDVRGNGSQSERAIPPAVSEHPSDHTKIWSDLSGSAARSSDGNIGRQSQTEGNPTSGIQNDMQMPDTMNPSKATLGREAVPDVRQPMETDHLDEPQDVAGANGNPCSQHHRSNWVGAGDDEEEDEDDGELCVQSTPQYYD